MSRDRDLGIDSAAFRASGIPFSTYQLLLDEPQAHSLVGRLRLEAGKVGQARADCRVGIAVCDHLLELFVLDVVADALQDLFVDADVVGSELVLAFAEKLPDALAERSMGGQGEERKEKKKSNNTRKAVRMFVSAITQDCEAQTRT